MSRRPRPGLSLSELEGKTLVELQVLAKERGLSRVTGIRKGELIRKLLEEKTTRNGFQFCTGVLEVLSEGYGFLRSSDLLWQLVMRSQDRFGNRRTERNTTPSSG